MKRFEYKKVINFTKEQKQTFDILESYGVNINEFIRISIREKITRDWKSIKEKKEKEYCPF